MSLLLKIMSCEDAPDEDSRKTFCLYTDITSCHFRRHPDGSAEAHVWCREPIKTAMVPGFVEIEKHIILTGNAYLMNENGKTVSSFGVARYEDGRHTGPLGRDAPKGNLILIGPDRERVIEALDSLGLALVGHSHQWSMNDRRQYESAISLLDADKNRRHPTIRGAHTQATIEHGMNLATPDAKLFTKAASPRVFSRNREK
jgi:hypothetical protein